MVGLLEKDIRLILMRKSVLLIYLIVCLICTWYMPGAYCGAYVTMMASMITLSTLTYDDSDNCMNFLLTLPCTRKQYVFEKYIFVYGFSLAGALAAIVINFIAEIIKGSKIESSMIIEIFLSVLPLLILLGGIMIPLQIKFGVEKTRIILLIIVGLGFAFKFWKNKIWGYDITVPDIWDYIDNMNQTVLLLAMIGVLAVVSVISVASTIVIVEHKEY